MFRVHETGPRPSSKAENDSHPGMNSLIDLLGIDVGYQMIRENLASSVHDRAQESILFPVPLSFL